MCVSTAVSVSVDVSGSRNEGSGMIRMMDGWECDSGLE